MVAVVAPYGGSAFDGGGDHQARPGAEAGYQARGSRPRSSLCKSLMLYTARRPFRLPEMNFDQPRATTAVSYVKNSRPRYVLDTQPVSYEQPSSF